MAVNEPLAYGYDVKCVLDADELWTPVNGLGLLYQDCVHVLTQDDFLGPGGTGRGYDVRRLLGLPTSRLSAQQPVIAEVLQRDERIERAEVKLVPTSRNGQLASIEVQVNIFTAAGPTFSFVLPVSQYSAAVAQGQAS